MVTKKKRKPWYEKHHEKCEEFRAQFGVEQGEGLRILAEMKRSEFPEIYDMAMHIDRCARSALWSVDYLDAYVGAMMKNPLFERMRQVGMEKTREEVQCRLCQTTES